MDLVVIIEPVVVDFSTFSQDMLTEPDKSIEQQYFRLYVLYVYNSILLYHIGMTESLLLHWGANRWSRKHDKKKWLIFIQVSADAVFEEFCDF